MKDKLRNLFFLIGVGAVAVMLWKFEMPYDEVLQNVQRAGIWFPAVLLLWGVIYFMNTCAWQVILETPRRAFLFGKYISILLPDFLLIMSHRWDFWAANPIALWR